MRYRRFRIPGGTYFFTVVTKNRKKIFTSTDNVNLLRKSIQYVMKNNPFTIDAFVVLPDHFHCIWKLPEGDDDFSTRMSILKGTFTRLFNIENKIIPKRSQWQKRFWEHAIKDANDYANHIEYIHYNPVKHGLVSSPAEWHFTSFHRYVKAGIYPPEWGVTKKMEFNKRIGGE